MRNRGIFKYGTGVFALHVLGIILLGISVSHHPALLGMALLAYTFGLRHAFDVDHIAFIDNTVRKFLEQKKNPSGIGFYFSLGHSTVVVIMSILTAIAVHWMQQKLPQLQNIGGILGTLISGVFLLLLGFVNLFIWLKLYTLFLQMKHRQHQEQELDELLNSRGLIAKFVRPLMRFITKDWHAYPIGFLFGLGFDTASEVALLAISATAARSALPLTGVLALPIFFASGMSLMDTADGMFMTTAYGWAFSTPLRKIYYNLSVTGLGVLAASLIGVIELAQVLSSEFNFHNRFWIWLQQLDFGTLGYLLVALFLLVWSISFGSWKLLEIEERWNPQSYSE
ncbi:HoxN/HupN/NixA family nickel/cobalt transporter [Sulfoacidibacillus thermotolerans]|uniref:Nickel/cobalt efflux system n=1 Tax=Sulfoacidibacillus thermotolerans TaxID=1765684 RepID=A0A2U3DCR7_SULT2|nr:HoxN/HupN/NixA family nickel/cobalt transporter [Sulfoacidibacillus thermotolerans]PWI59080.1 nickel permease [Sulfoacidibacillus thermotolerans]